MEDIISLTPKQVKGLVWHLNEELYRQQILGLEGRIITEGLVDTCINCYNSPNIASSFEEQEKDQHELELAHGLKWSDKEYNEAFKDS